MTPQEKRDLALLVVEKLADRFESHVRDGFLMLRDERDTAQPDGLPAGVVSLDARRARRAA